MDQVKFLESLVREGDTELSGFLEILQLGRMKISTSNLLLVRFLDAARESSQREIVKDLVEYWTPYYREPISFRTYLYLIPTMSVDTMKLVEEVFDDYGYLQHIIELAAQKSSPEVVTACFKIDKVFGPQGPDVYHQALGIIEPHNNHLLQDYMTDKYRDVSGYAPVPTWVNNTHSNVPTQEELMKLIPEDTRVEFVIPTDNNAIVEAIYNSMINIMGPEFSCNADAYNMIADKYYQANHSERMEMIRPLITTEEVYLKEANVELIRALGPSHPIIGYGGVIETNDVEDSYGGSRMFLSNIFRDYDESGHVLDDDDEWYVGYCQQCNLKLRARHHALRMPIEGGGWMGCYCSFKCVRDYVTVDNQVRLTLIDNFETIITTSGIQDRIWPVKKTENSANNTAIGKSFREAMSGDYLVTPQLIPGFATHSPVVPSTIQDYAPPTTSFASPVTNLTLPSLELPTTSFTLPSLELPTTSLTLPSLELPTTTSSLPKI